MATKSKAASLAGEAPQAEAEGRELDHEEQAAHLAEYKLTGVNRGYIDQSRDQEPDIGGDLGQAPHPELFNPEPSELSNAVAGIGTKSDSVLVDLEKK